MIDLLFVKCEYFFCFRDNVGILGRKICGCLEFSKVELFYIYVRGDNYYFLLLIIIMRKIRIFFLDFFIRIFSLMFYF